MTLKQDHCVIVGAGHACAQLCASLKQAKWPGKITVFGDEAILPYHRPPLSKTFLDQTNEANPQLIRPANFYVDNDITVRAGNRVDAIDRANKQITADGKRVPYDHLVLATGSLHRRPPIIGIDHPRVFGLRTAAEALRIRDAMRGAKRVILIGAGFIGLEVAASLRKQNVEVSVFEFAPRVLARVASPPSSKRRRSANEHQHLRTPQFGRCRNRHHQCRRRNHCGLRHSWHRCGRQHGTCRRRRVGNRQRRCRRCVQSNRRSRHLCHGRLLRPVPSPIRCATPPRIRAKCHGSSQNHCRRAYGLRNPPRCPPVVLVRPIRREISDRRHQYWLRPNGRSRQSSSRPSILRLALQERSSHCG